MCPAAAQHCNERKERGESERQCNAQRAVKQQLRRCRLYLTSEQKPDNALRESKNNAKYGAGTAAGNKIGKIYIASAVPRYQLVAQRAAGIIAADEQRRQKRRQHRHYRNIGEKAEIHDPHGALTADAHGIYHRHRCPEKHHKHRDKAERSVPQQAREDCSQQLTHCAHLPQDSYKSSQGFRPAPLCCLRCSFPRQAPTRAP
ncbi:unknown [Anaerotruncus sp. CAG:390]|nr:unknown [Anaerotruncus sp. CAG:390]